MKKIYLGLSALALSTVMVAQSNNSATEALLQLNTSTQGKKIKDYAPHQKASVTLWSNDFDTPADWVADNDGQPSPFGWTVDATNSGWWSTAGITSTSGGNFAELYNGNPTNNTPAPVGSTFTLTTAAPIDVDALSGGNNSVSLQFEQYGARFQDLQEVYVSVDGTTWTLVGSNDDIDSHTAGSANPYANPMLRKFNIGSAIATSPSSVWLRFSWAPDVQNITYGWYIDDVKIVTNEDHEIDIVSTNFGSYGFWEETMPYYQVPLDQITDITFSAIIKNIGAIDQTNTALTVNVNSGAATVSSPAGFTSDAGTNDTLMTAAFMPTAATVATYNFDMLVESDNVDASPANNTASASIATNDFIYARDMGVANGAFSNQGADYEVGNVFDIFANATLYSIQTQVATTSTGNPIAYATLYSIDATTGDFIFMETTDEITITTAQVTSGAVINLPLLSPVNLVAGSGYLVVVGTYAGTTDYLQIANSGVSAPQTTFLNDVSTSTWFYSTSTPMVRMNFQVPPPTVSMNSAAFSMTESDGTFDLVLDITEAPAADVTVNLARTGGTASAADYTFTSPTTVTFPAGSMASQTVAVPVINDGIAEGAETIIFALSNVSANGAIGAGTTTVTIDANVSVTEKSIEGATLGQNFPNPANGNTSINYTLTEKANVMIQVTDVAGKIINVMNEGDKVAGTYTVNVNTADLSAGTYFYTLSTEKGTVTKSMNVIK